MQYSRNPGRGRGRREGIGKEVPALPTVTVSVAAKVATWPRIFKGTPCTFEVFSAFANC